MSTVGPGVIGVLSNGVILLPTATNIIAIEAKSEFWSPKSELAYSLTRITSKLSLHSIPREDRNLNQGRSRSRWMLSGDGAGVQMNMPSGVFGLSAIRYSVFKSSYQDQLKYYLACTAVASWANSSARSLCRAFCSEALFRYHILHFAFPQPFAFRFFD